MDAKVLHAKMWMYRTIPKPVSGVYILGHDLARFIRYTRRAADRIWNLRSSTRSFLLARLLLRFLYGNHGSDDSVECILCGNPLAEPNRYVSEWVTFLPLSVTSRSGRALRRSICGLCLTQIQHAVDNLRKTDAVMAAQRTGAGRCPHRRHPASAASPATRRNASRVAAPAPGARPSSPRRASVAA
jgi:hypothetical protein